MLGEKPRFTTVLGYRTKCANTLSVPDDALESSLIGNEASPGISRFGKERKEV